MRKPHKAEWGVLAISVAVTLALFNNLCHLVFRCGCHSWWTGAAEHCNIHNASGRHCPWCVMGSGWLAATVAGILTAQAFAVLLPARWNWSARLAAGLAAFPVSGALLGVIAGVCLRYWN